MYKGYLRNGLVCTLTSIFIGVISLIVSYFSADYRNTIVEHPLLVLIIIGILIFLGFVTGISLGYLLKYIKLKELLKNGILGIVFVFIFSLVLSLFESFFTVGRINVFQVLIYSFLIWFIPGFIFGILSGFILRKLKIE